MKANRKIKELTIIKCLVTYKCLGYFGKSFTPFTMPERNYIVNYMIEKGWLTESMALTTDGDNIVKSNLTMLNY